MATAERLLAAVTEARLENPSVGSKALVERFRRERCWTEVDNRAVKAAIETLRDQAAEARKQVESEPPPTAAPKSGKRRNTPKPGSLEERFGGLTMREWEKPASLRQLIEPALLEPIETGLSKVAAGRVAAARRHFVDALAVAEQTEPPDSLIRAFLLRNLANTEAMGSEERLARNVQVLEILELRHRPPVSSIFRWSQKEHALSKIGGDDVNLGYMNLLLASMGVFNTLIGGGRDLRTFEPIPGMQCDKQCYRQLCELPPVVTRTLDRLPMLIAEANAQDRDLISLGWFSPAWPDGRVEHNAPLAVRTGMFRSLVPRGRDDDGEWSRISEMQMSLVECLLLLGSKEGTDIYLNKLSEHLPAEHNIWRDAPGRTALASFQETNLKLGQDIDERMAARNNRLGLRPCALPCCSATEQFARAFQRCARCRGVAYCCPEHQQQHWKEHKKECKECSAL
tara:strand:- start:102 stop:1466 length:1365 start_codon:yes stop_codon:yes gene_type:complete